MNNDIKIKLDALEKLRNGAWEEFNNRRIYEWKMSISIWTALAAFIALILAHRVQVPSNCINKIFATIVMAIIWFLHARFLYKLTKSNRIDRDKQFLYEEQIRTILNIKFTDKLKKNISDRQKERENHPLRDWSEFVQIAVTFVLLIVAFCVVFYVHGQMTLCE